MNVKELRESLRMTQQEMAYKIGVTLRTVQNWESGRPVPPASEKLLMLLKEGKEIVSSGYANNKGVIVAAGNGSSVILTPDVDRFFTSLERQQDLMSRMLEELSQMRLLTIKKDEQIDMLLSIAKSNKNSITNRISYYCKMSNKQ